MVRIAVISSIFIVQALSSAPSASAQNPRDIIDLLGGIMRSAIAQAAQAEWQKLPPAEVTCVDQVLQSRGTSLRRSIEQGIAPTDARMSEARSICRAQFARPTSSPIRTGVQKSVYAVEGISLGDRVSFHGADYRKYECGPSEQFDGFTWCKKTYQDKEKRGSFTVSATVLHSSDGRAFYVNRYQEPAFWSASEAADDIQSLSRKFAEQPRISRLPNRSGLPNGIMAQWGQVTLESLDDQSIKILAEGKSPSKGILVDFIGNFTRSAKQGLPIYRVAGGPGFVWAASYDQQGRGTLRFFAVDASAYSPRVAINPAPTNPQPSTTQSATTPPPKPPRSPADIMGAARKGDPIAQLELGTMYATRQSLAKDDTQAVAWFRKAADQGNADAQYELGIAYDTGQGVDKDGSHALSWYQKAAAQGHQGAKKRLGEAGSIVHSLGSTVTAIQNGLPIVSDVDSRKQIEGIAARLATANDKMPLPDLHALRNEADVAIRILDEANDFKNVSEIADKRVAEIKALLKQITSDAQIVRDIEDAIQSLRKEQAGTNLSALKDAFAKLNSLYDSNRAKLNQLKFDVY